jgi:hypothetical protein
MWQTMWRQTNHYNEDTGDGIYSEEWICSAAMASAFLQDEEVRIRLMEYLDIASGVLLEVVEDSLKAGGLCSIRAGDYAAGNGLADSLFGMGQRSLLVTAAPTGSKEDWAMIA